MPTNKTAILCPLTKGVNNMTPHNNQTAKNRAAAHGKSLDELCKVDTAELDAMLPNFDDVAFDFDDVAFDFDLDMDIPELDEFDKSLSQPFDFEL